MFVKLYAFDDIGQVLVKHANTDDGYEVKLYCEPEGFGICSMAINFPDTDTGFESSNKCFGAITSHHAENTARKIISELDGGAK